MTLEISKEKRNEEEKKQKSKEFLMNLLEMIRKKRKETNLIMMIIENSVQLEKVKKKSLNILSMRSVKCSWLLPQVL